MLLTALQLTLITSFNFNTKFACLQATSAEPW